MGIVIGVIGAGSVGRALAGGLSTAGHAVRFGVRDPDDAKYADLAAGSVAVRDVVDAIEGADVVILAVPASALEAAVRGLPLAAGQVVVDATNAVGTTLPAGFDTLGEFVASFLPDGVSLVKAFNTIGAEHLDGGHFEAGPAFLPIAGDEPGRAVVVALATDLGFEVADVGGRERIRLVEDHARLWIHLALRCGWGRTFGFVVARD